VTDKNAPFVTLYVVPDSEIKKAKIKKVDQTKAPEQLGLIRIIFIILFLSLALLIFYPPRRKISILKSERK
jgi:hypothetical protein